MTISFEKENNELILCYAPVMGTEELSHRLKNSEGFSIKNTFWVTRENLRDTDENDFDDTLRFCIGKVGEKYTELDIVVLGTDHKFFFSNDIVLKHSHFVAYRNISILGKIDKIIERDLFIGGKWEETEGMPLEAYEELLATFPKTAELDKYANSRIAIILKEFFPECDRYEDIYRRYIDRRNQTTPPVVSEYLLNIELAQFTAARDELKSMLDHAEGYSENDWQKRIGSIIRLLYPKYIAYKEKVSLKGVDGYDKEPDFLLVDSNGYIDILEIKKADVRILTKQASYRRNYTPVREFSGAIQQIEKYIFCLNTVEKNLEAVKKAFTGFIPKDVEIKLVNPQGILLAGRSNHFTSQQKDDFELIKRQYKHIADVMTYDDLLQRLNNTINALQIGTTKNSNKH